VIIYLHSLVNRIFRECSTCCISKNIICIFIFRLTINYQLQQTSISIIFCISVSGNIRRKNRDRINQINHIFRLEIWIGTIVNISVFNIHSYRVIKVIFIIIFYIFYYITIFPIFICFFCGYLRRTTSFIIHSSLHYNHGIRTAKTMS